MYFVLYYVFYVLAFGVINDDDDGDDDDNRRYKVMFSSALITRLADGIVKHVSSCSSCADEL